MNDLIFLVVFIYLLDLILYWASPYKKRISHKWYKRYLPFSGFYFYFKYKLKDK